MKKVYPIITIILVAFVILLLHQNSFYRAKTRDLQTEIKTTSKYIETLKKQLLKTKKSVSNGFEKDEYLKELLKDYMNERASKTSEDSSKDEFKKYMNKNKLIPDIYPVKGEFEISQTYSESHKAIDFAAPIGSEVVSTAYGEVVCVKYDKYFGNVLEIDHFNGYGTMYAHLAKILVEEGELVKKNQTIALVGDTGNSSAPHLHFEIKFNGLKINPLDRIKSKG